MTRRQTSKFKICVKHNKAFCNSCVIEGMENEIRRLREENEQLKEELDSHEAWKAVSEMAQRESEHLLNQQQKLIKALEEINNYLTFTGEDAKEMRNIARSALDEMEGDM